MALYISHRGESFDAPENTLAAFNLSNSRDVEGMETDIHFTADKLLVCGHDNSTKRMSGVDRIIEETPYAELKTLDVSGNHEAYRGERIPLFSESLKTLKPGRKYYVEVKENDENVLPAMRTEIERSGIPFSQIVLISFKADIVGLCKKYMPEIPALWLAWVGRNNEGKLTYTWDEVFATLERTGATGLDLGGTPECLTKEALAEVKKRGYYLAVWTIDDPERCRFFEEAGVDAITSNKAAEMKKILHG